MEHVRGNIEQTTAMDTEWLSVREIAGMFQVKEETVRRWIRRGELPVVQGAGKRAAHRVARSDLHAFINQRYRAAHGTGPVAPPAQSADPDVQSILTLIPGTVYLAEGDLSSRRSISTGAGLEKMEIDSWPANIHPDDIRSVQQAVDDSGREQVLDIEYRIVTSNHDVIWVRDYAVPVEDECWHGLIIDISDDKRVEQELELAKDREVALFAAIHGILGATGIDGMQQAAITAIGSHVDVQRVEIVCHSSKDPGPDKPAAISVPIPDVDHPSTLIRVVPTAQLEDAELDFIRMIADTLAIATGAGEEQPASGPWKSIRDIAEMLQVQEETVRRWIRRDELQIMNLSSSRAGYRVHPVDLEAFIRAHYRGR